MVGEGGALPCSLQCPGNGGSSEERALLGSCSCCIQMRSASRAQQQQQRLLRLMPFFCLLSPGSPCQVLRHICSPLAAHMHWRSLSLSLTHTHTHTHTRICLMFTPAPTPPPLGRTSVSIPSHARRLADQGSTLGGRGIAVRSL